MPITLSAELPPLRMLLIMDNLVGHKTPELVSYLPTESCHCIRRYRGQG